MKSIINLFNKIFSSLFNDSEYDKRLILEDLYQSGYFEMSLSNKIRLIQGFIDSINEVHDNQGGKCPVFYQELLDELREEYLKQ